MSEETRVHLNKILDNVIHHVESQCIGSVKSWITSPNPLYTVVHKRHPNAPAHKNFTFTAQVVDSAPTLTFPLDHPRMEEFYSWTREFDSDLYELIAAAVYDPDFENRWTCRVAYMTHTRVRYRIYLQYVIRGMEKHIVFKPNRDYLGTPADPCLEIAAFLDLLLGTRIEDSIVHERNNPHNSTYNLPKTCPSEPVLCTSIANKLDNKQA